MRSTTAALAALAAVAAAVAAVLLARRRRRAAENRKPGTLWACTCGRQYRTTGLGRHQVHWAADAPDDQPVMGDTCPNCGTPLRGPELAAAA